MKRIFIFFVVGFSLFLNAQGYQDEAKRLALQGEYDKAIELYSLQISLSEVEKVDQVLSIYNDRGDTYFAKNDFVNALHDYQIVLSNVKYETWEAKSNLLRAICGSVFCFLFLDDDESGKREFNHLVNFLLILGDDIENIGWIKNSAFNSYRRKWQNIRNRGHFYNGINKNNESLIAQTNLPDATPEEHCQTQCLGYAFAAGIACSRLPNPFIQALCAGCIVGLEQLCGRCCKGKGFWENCVKPLRRLYHDPENYENPAPHPYE